MDDDASDEHVSVPRSRERCETQRRGSHDHVRQRERAATTFDRIDIEFDDGEKEIKVRCWSSVIAAVVLALQLTACSSGDEPARSEPARSTASPPRATLPSGHASSASDNAPLIAVKSEATSR